MCNSSRSAEGGLDLAFEAQLYEESSTTPGVTNLGEGPRSPTGVETEEFSLCAKALSLCRFGFSSYIIFLGTGGL